jgi:hypothetical protein
MLKAAMLFSRVWSLLTRIPWQVWAAIALAGLIALYGHHREAQGRYEGRAEILAKWDRAKAENERARIKEEKRQAALSKGADRAVIEKTFAERDRTESFIARGGVRNTCARTDQATVPSAGSGEALHSSPVMDGGERLPTVAVTPDDVRVCSTNTILAEEFRKVLLGLEG